MAYKITVRALGRDEVINTAIDYGQYDDKFGAIAAVIAALQLDANDYWVTTHSIEITFV